MNFQDDGKQHGVPGTSGLEINCHRCGSALPLLHPHIMLERTDEDENLICEQCYENTIESGGGRRC